MASKTETYITIEELYIAPDELEFDREFIRRAMGYRNSEDAEFINDEIEKVLKEAPGMVDIKAGYALFDPAHVSFENDKFTIAGQRFDSEKIITSRLKKAESIAIFAATIGPTMENESKKEMSEGDPLRGYVIDTAASEIVELAADKLELALADEVGQREWEITNRYSPGYCGWHVSEQQKLFSLLPDNFLGIALSPSSLMIPVKSVSGVIGVGSDVKKREYQCSICDMKNCYRRVYT